MAYDKVFYEELQGYVKEYVSIFNSPIVQQLDQMKLTLLRAQDSFTCADNEYKFLSSSFPINIVAKMLENEKKGLA